MRQQSLNVSDRLRIQQHVAAHVANFRRNVIDNHHLARMSHGMHNVTPLVISRTIFDCAFHGFCPRCVGVSHFGDFGSYTVIMISIGFAVVQTT